MASKPSRCLTCSRRMPMHLGSGFALGELARCGDGHPDHQPVAGPHPRAQASPPRQGHHRTATSGPVGPTPCTAASTPPPDPMAAGALTNAGGSQPHENMPPYQVMNFITGRSRASSRPRTDAETGVDSMSDPYSGEIKLFAFNFAAQGLGVLQRAALAHQPEPGAVLDARHHVRRQRPDELRAAQPAGPRSGPPGSRNPLSARAAVR